MIKRILSIILTLCIISSIAVFADGQIEVNSDGSSAQISGDKATQFVNEVVNLIMRKYKFDTKKEDLYRGALEKIITENPELLETAFEGMLEDLDDYSIYYKKEDLDGFMENMEGEICGIGVLITASDNGLVVSKVYDDSPALEAGLMQGDIITHASGVYLGGMDIEIAKQNIVGPEYTPVTITVMRNGISQEKTLIRRKVTIEAGFHQMIEDNKIMYIRLDEFNSTAAEFIKKALDEAKQNGSKNILFDLRSNPGGSLNELVEVCSLFIPSGPAIHLEYKNPLKFTTLNAENEGKTPDYNLAVLIDSASASASEAFAAAIQDTKSGIVVGEKSFGKGTMQNITRFVTGGGIKLTEAEYLTPNGRKVNGIGVSPDVEAADKLTSYERADLTDMTYDRVLKIGDEGKDVLAIEERLRLLGLSVGIPDGIFDYDTYTATVTFQKYSELYPYGVMDFTTQAKLESTLSGQQVRNDTSYKKAIEILKNGSVDEYMRDWSNK